MPTCAGSRECHVIARPSPSPGDRSMPHPAIVKDNVAVITGGASGIGFAAAAAFARDGMKVCIADVDQAGLAGGATKLSSPTAATHRMTLPVDVRKGQGGAGLGG